MSTSKESDKGEMPCFRKTTLYQNCRNILDKSGNQSVLSSINSGYSNIEKELLGLQLGQLYVFGGAVAMGKTLFIGQLALQVAEESSVLYLQLFESLDKLTKRLISTEGDIPFYQLEHKPWDEKIAGQIKEILNSFENKKFFMEKLWRYKEQELFDLIEDYVTRSGVQLVIIDDEERLFKNLEKTLNSEEKYMLILRLKVLLTRLDCCAIILKKIKSAKRTQKNPFKLPSVKDLQQEYNLAEIADHIWFMHRLEYYGIEKDGVNNKTEKRIDLYCMDENDGVLNTFYFKFNKRFTSIEVMEEPSCWEFDEE
jgi:replicative DNA helicase